MLSLARLGKVGMVVIVLSKDVCGGSHKKVILAIYRLQKAEMVFWPSPHRGASKGQRASSVDPMSPDFILTTELENVAE